SRSLLVRALPSLRRESSETPSLPPPFRGAARLQHGRSYPAQNTRTILGVCTRGVSKRNVGRRRLFFPALSRFLTPHRGGVMGSPRANQTHLGLTSGEVAKQLGCSRTHVDRLRKCGDLPARPDHAGHFRFQPAAVRAIAKTLGRTVRTDAAVQQ